MQESFEDILEPLRQMSPTTVYINKLRFYMCVFLFHLIFMLAPDNKEGHLIIELIGKWAIDDRERFLR